MVWVYILFFLTCGFALAAMMVMVLTVVTLVGGAPFVQSADARLKVMLRLAKVKKGVRAADIGAGDGKIVIALAKLGAEAHGYEINPFLVWRGRRNIRKNGVEGQAFMHLTSLWQVDYSSFELITLYGITHIMNRLERKLQRELKKGTVVISNYFTFPNWKPAKEEEGVLLYVKS